MAIASVANDYVLTELLLQGSAEEKSAGVRLELPCDKMGTFLAVGLPLLLISLSFAQEVPVGSQITCFAPQNFSSEQAAYVDSFCWAAVQYQSVSLWLYKFFPYILLLMAILVCIPALFWRFTAAPHLSSDLKFIMKELYPCYKRAVERAIQRVSPGSTVSADSSEDTPSSVSETTRSCFQYPLVEHYLKSKCSSRSLVIKYLACRGLTFVFLLLACAFLCYYICLPSLSDEFSCDLRTGVLQNDSVLPSAVQCKLVAVGVFRLLSIINLVMYALLLIFVACAFYGLKHQSPSFLHPYEILKDFDNSGVSRPSHNDLRIYLLFLKIMAPFNDLSIYLLFLKENLSHVESFKRLQALQMLLPLEAPPQSSSQGQGDSASIRRRRLSTYPL